MNATTAQLFPGVLVRSAVDVTEPFDGMHDAAGPSGSGGDGDFFGDADTVTDGAGCDDDLEAASSRQRSPAANEPTAAQPALAPDEEQLRAWLDRIADRDDRALSALYDATVSRVYGLVLRILRRPAWAEEVVEDTYFQVWRQALRFDPERGRALTWLLGMARSRAIDAMRREHRFEHEPLEDVDLLPAPGESASSAEDCLAQTRSQALLHQALATLGPQPRQLVALAFFRGLSHEEISEQTALPLGTVKSQIRRALAALQKVLGESGLPAPSG
jgi:RNA polymerase sigma-70 factor (ECF subfamily)